MIKEFKCESCGEIRINKDPHICHTYDWCKTCKKWRYFN